MTLLRREQMEAVRLSGPPIVIESTDTYEKPDNLHHIVVKMCAAGASGGGVSCVVGEAVCANGGGGGEYAEKFILADDLAASENITIGIGGAAPTAGDNDGNDGGDTSFGSHFDVHGGKAGSGSSSTTNYPISGAAAGGEGGDGGTGGDLHIPGRPAKWGFINNAISCVPSSGGASFISGAVKSGASGVTDENGVDGKGYGGGGSGARATNTNGNYSGGKGEDGVCYIYEYIYGE